MATLLRCRHLARWPDATFEDGKIWRMMESCRSTDGGYNVHKGEWEGQTRLGLIYDDQFHVLLDLDLLKVTQGMYSTLILHSQINRHH